MRISDWSSDVCSSDLLTPRCQMYRPLTVLTHGSVAPLFASPSQQPLRIKGPLESAVIESNGPNDSSLHARPGFYDERLAMLAKERRYDSAIICVLIGRASCREKW